MPKQGSKLKKYKYFSLAELHGMRTGAATLSPEVVTATSSMKTHRIETTRKKRSQSSPFSPSSKNHSSSCDDASSSSVSVSLNDITATTATATATATVLDVWTDGACSNNADRLRALAGTGVYFGDGDARNLSEPLPGALQTNQRAELYAAMRALQVAPTDVVVRIVTDSKYTKNVVTEYRYLWDKYGTWEGKKNLDIIRPLIAEVDKRAASGMDVQWKWVHGHSGVRGNEMADRLAVASLKMHPLRLSTGALG
ncbi:MAG: ribonuclease H family protein [Candidatus Paceibacterota bacterium]|jgi:ribonuclease HI